MENTLENKKKFFALYYDVPCIQNDEWIWRESDEFGKLPHGSDITNCYAILKPLSLITDEDAKTVATIFNYDKEYNALRPQEIGANRFRLIQETIFPHFMQTTFMHFNFLFLKVTHYPGWAYR